VKESSIREILWKKLAWKRTGCHKKARAAENRCGLNLASMASVRREED